MRLWKYCVGYVNIGIMGKYPERLVNRCLEAGVPLSGVRRLPQGLSADISIRDMKRLRFLARGSGCRVRIIKKRGVPCAYMRAVKNAWFFAALAVFAALVFAVSTRVWFISVDSSIVPKEEVLAALDEMGVRPGARRRGISAGAIASRLDGLDLVTNAKVTLSGVKLGVVISDRAEDEDVPPAGSPSDIYADKDCVITYISVSSGRAAVKAGQHVKKGDLLIRGDLSDLKPGLKVSAEGTVMGEVLYTFSATESAFVSRLVRSGRSETVVIPEVFGRRIGVRLPFEESELEPLRRARIAGALPVFAAEYRCCELVNKAVMDTPEHAELRARLSAQELLYNAVPHEAKLTTVKTTVKRNDDGSFTAVINATAVEKTGVRRGI